MKVIEVSNFYECLDRIGFHGINKFPNGIYEGQYDGYYDKLMLNLQDKYSIDGLRTRYILLFDATIEKNTDDDYSFWTAEVEYDSWYRIEDIEKYKDKIDINNLLDKVKGNIVKELI